MPVLSFKSVLWFLLTLLALWIGGFLYFTNNIQISKPAFVPNVDGIVILTGSTRRLNDGFKLLNEGKAKRLLVSGVNLQVTKEELRVLTGQTKAVMDCCVDLGRLARDTVGNARETALWAKKNSFKSLIIVTSAYHLPRSMTELVSFLPGVTMVGYATHDEKIKLESWWSNPGTAMLLFREFNKYIYSLLRARIQRFLTNEKSS